MLNNFVRENIDKTKGLYTRKNNTLYPCLHDINSIGGPEGIVDFDSKKHEDQHVKQGIREDRCQYCMLMGPQECIDELFQILMQGQTPEKEANDKQAQIRIA